MTRRSPSLSEKAYDALKDDILRCALAPGEFVTEADLAERYGVSKTPIREALNLLSQEGFIQSVPRRGTLIRPIELRDIQQTYLLRGLLEPPAAALAAEKANGEQIEALGSLLDGMTEHSQNSDGSERLRHEQLRSHRQFHLAIGEASGIPRLARMINSLHEEVERSMNANAHLGGALTFGDMDRELFEAIANGDAQTSQELAAKSVEVSRQSLIEAFLGVG